MPPASTAGRYATEPMTSMDRMRNRSSMESEFGGFSYEAQGTIVDSQDGDWYGIILKDRGGVGRVPTLMPCRWINGWPMLGDENGKVPDTMRPLVSGQPATGIVRGDDFSSAKLGLHWQWNHNPVDAAWSLTERPGFLRLKSSRVVDNLYLTSQHTDTADGRTHLQWQYHP